MLLKPESDVIVEYAMANADNLRIALLICDQHMKIKQAIVDGFAKKVCDELEKQASGWRLELRSFFEAEKGIRLLKPSWKGRFDICVAAENAGLGNMFVGVKNYTDANPTKDGKLFRTLNEHFRQGRCGGSWEWYAYLEGSYRHWYTRDALLALYSDQAALDEVVHQLCRIKTVAEPIIDEYLSAASGRYMLPSVLLGRTLKACSQS